MLSGVVFELLNQLVIGSLPVQGTMDMYVQGGRKESGAGAGAPVDGHVMCMGVRLH